MQTRTANVPCNTYKGEVARSLFPDFSQVSSRGEVGCLRSTGKMQSIATFNYYLNAANLHRARSGLSPAIEIVVVICQGAESKTPSKICVIITPVPLG